ncbi:lipocalin-like domain-containing protein [Pontiellaceae bacterium B1224]|nr:lipocalin-like domain-containing protein [Pontiellaceae bacterium B1224]
MKMRILTSWLILATVQSSHAEKEPRMAEGFRIPTENPAFTFPRDYGSHPEFKIEWWYITGHLRDAAERRFGFQATFFRYAHQAGAVEVATPFGTNQLFMAHMAVSDIEEERFFHEERLNRDGWDASAAIDDLNLKNGNWSLVRLSDGSMELQAGIGSDVQLQFNLEPVQPLVFFGKEGLSKKGSEPSACSWYLTYPRLRTTGTLELDGKKLEVSGESWMDHEISSSQLGREQVGWDWLSVRFDDGEAMMIYILRDANGIPDPHSTLAWIERDHTLHHVGPDQFRWTSSNVWKSQETGSTYPIDVLVEGMRPDGRPFSFTVKPLMRNQELVGELGGISYWEGACDVFEGNRKVGEAYMELTGYGKSLKESL